MKRMLVIALLGVAFLTFAPSSSAQTQDCQPFGPSNAGPQIDTFNFIADGVPSSASVCWSMFNAAIGQGTMVCGFYPQWTSNNFEFGYGGDVNQGFVIPADKTYNYYTFVYFLDFQNPDPNYPGDLQLNIQIWDQTAHTVLLTDHYDASQPALSCARREISAVTGSLAGHSILVLMMGTRTGDTSHIRVASVQFWGEHR